MNPFLLPPLHALIDVVESNPFGVLDFILRTGTTGLLLVAVYLFMAGKILPASVVEKQQAQLNTLVTATIADVIKGSVKEAVRVGMLEAWKEIDLSYHRKGAKNANRENLQNQ